MYEEGCDTGAVSRLTRISITTVNDVLSKIINQ